MSGGSRTRRAITGFRQDADRDRIEPDPPVRLGVEFWGRARDGRQPDAHQPDAHDQAAP